MSALTAEQLAAIDAAYEVVGSPRLPYCPLEPTPRQEAFLLLDVREALFGGVAGGGKSVALLMDALQYADVPGYAALLLRPSLNEFRMPGGLLGLASDWLTGSKATWVSDTNTWRFPGPGIAGSGGATLTFGYLEGANDVARYSGLSFSYLGFDELTRFSESHYRRMFRVLRQAKTGDASALAAPDGTRLKDVPARARATSNPGGPGHNWVKEYFVDPRTRKKGAIFFESWLEDNPYMDGDYLASLAMLPNAERERLLRGNWDIPDDGSLFQRDWFQIIERSQLPATTRAVRYWDLAATEPGAAAPDPDYTVGLKLEVADGIYYITDIVRIRKPPGTVEEIMASTAKRDGRDVPIMIEQEPGSAGKGQIHDLARHVLAGFTVRGHRVTGPKELRAHPVAAAAENGLIRVVRGPHLRDLLDELVAFPNASHDDCVDALSGAYTVLPKHAATFQVSRPKGQIPSHLAERQAYARLYGLPDGGIPF